MSERNGYGYIQTMSGSLLLNSVSNQTSSADVSDYYTFGIQSVIKATGNSTSSLIVESSIDNQNWHRDFTFVATSDSASLNQLVGKRGCIRALSQIINNATGSVHIIAGP
jgi:hypothetical protein